MSKLGMKPEDAYEEISNRIIAVAKEYGVDITSGSCAELLNDVYDKCHEDLWQNEEEEE